MLYILYILLAISLIAVVFTLIMGGKAMSKRDESSQMEMNKWLWRRIWAQVFALVMVGLTVLVKRNGG